MADDNNIYFFSISHFVSRAERRPEWLTSNQIVVRCVVVGTMNIFRPFRKWLQSDKERKSFIYLCYGFWAADERTRKDGDEYLSVVIKFRRYSLLIFFSVCASQAESIFRRLERTFSNFLHQTHMYPFIEQCQYSYKYK